jgi:hypothetical protein
MVHNHPSLWNCCVKSTENMPDENVKQRTARHIAGACLAAGALFAPAAMPLSSAMRRCHAAHRRGDTLRAFPTSRDRTLTLVGEDLQQTAGIKRVTSLQLCVLFVYPSAALKVIDMKDLTVSDRRVVRSGRRARSGYRVAPRRGAGDDECA